MQANNMLSSFSPKQEQPEKSTAGALWEKLGAGTKSTESDQHHFEQGGVLTLLFECSVRTLSKH